MSEAKGSVKQGLSNTGAMALLASVIVHADTATKQTLYTVPTGKHCVPTGVIIRNASVNFVASAASLTCGFNASANDWLPAVSPALLTTSSQAVVALASQNFAATEIDAIVVGNPADVFGCIFTDNAIVGTVVIDVFGYLY